MKIIDAEWEIRNIGVKTFEIMVDKEDTMEKFEEEERNIIDKKAEYIVVKTPVNMPEFIWGLSKLGYTFLEMNLSIGLTKDKFVVPNYISRLDRNMEVVHIAEKSELEKKLEIFKNDIFDTDRISVDPFFKKGSSANRYFFWINDMINSGCKFYNLRYKEKNLGFFLVKKIDEKTAYPVLAGLYPEYKGKGLGGVLIKRCVETIWENGFERIYTNLVSNNIEIIKIDLSIGFTIESSSYVYVKHI